MFQPINSYSNPNTAYWTALHNNNNNKKSVRNINFLFSRVSLNNMSFEYNQETSYPYLAVRSLQELNDQVYASLAKEMAKNGKIQAIQLYRVNFTAKYDLKLAIRSVNLNESDAIDRARDYYSPEKTSDRIVNFATNFFELYQGRHEKADVEFVEMVQNFLKLIKEAIDKGFNAARKVLGQVPDGISGKIDKTYELVQQKLDQWQSEILSKYEIQTAPGFIFSDG